MNISQGNLDKIKSGAKAFARAILSTKESAEVIYKALNIPKADDTIRAREQVENAVNDKKVLSNIVKGWIEVWSEKNAHYDLKLHNSNGMLIRANAKQNVDLSMTTTECLSMITTVFSNLDKPKAVVHPYGELGISLKPFIKEIRDDFSNNFKKNTKRRLITEMVDLHCIFSNVKREDNTDYKADLTKANSSILRAIVHITKAKTNGYKNTDKADTAIEVLQNIKL